MKSLALLSVVLFFGCRAEPTPLPAAPAAPAPAPSERTDRGWAKMATGCGDSSVQVSHADKRRFLMIGSSRKALGLTHVGDSKTVSLAGGEQALSLQMAVYAAPVGGAFCTDVVPTQLVPQTASLSAVAGTVTVTLTAFTSEGDFSIDVTLAGVRIPNQGTLEAVPHATYADVRVGWTAG